MSKRTLTTKELGCFKTAHGIRGLLKRLGFSSQKPIKQAYQRDVKRVDKWLTLSSKHAPCRKASYPF
ncbi:winged helix-turn-helix domain-containing protein [Legionella beliardensis]|uniref:winged helix-turn-helix domain-containing protein n=1 Tax=Legionella beliardensis TaxID=91822 RepID=UPI000E1BF8DB